MKLSIPGLGKVELKTVILDLNGTLSLRGKLVEGVQERLVLLKKKGFEIFLFSGDTRGNSKEVAQSLEIKLVVASSGKEKMLAAKKLYPETCVAIGNGLIDVPLFKVVRLSIATLQSEGAHTKCLQASEIVVPSVLDALDLLIDEPSLIATLRS